MRNGYLYIGISLFIAYCMQEVFELRWEYLRALQLDESFKRWSGLALLLYIVLQWSLTIFRSKKRWEVHTPLIMEIHKWMGAFSPLAFYIHSMKLGYAYLFVLSITYFTNVFLGFVHTDTIKTKAYWYFQSWMIAHVAFSLVISMLALYHIWIVFYYN
jgi:hypothetical protein